MSDPQPPTAPSPPPRSPGNGGSAEVSAPTRILRQLKRIVGKRERQQLLPTLIRVYAGFSKMGGIVAEEEIESSLGFLRYDFPEALFTDLVGEYRAALREPQNLAEVAKELSSQLLLEDKILLAVQTYVLISHNKLRHEELQRFLNFTKHLGIASEAREIIRQLTQATGGSHGQDRTDDMVVWQELTDAEPATDAGSLLEKLEIAAREPADVVLESLQDSYALTIFRYEGLLLLKNTGAATLIARGHQLRSGRFLRLYEGQRVVLGNMVLTHQDIQFYLNAKKGVSSTQLFLSLGTANHPFLEKVQSKQSVLRIRFGLTVEVEALQAAELTVAERPLALGMGLRVHLSEKIQFPNRGEVTFGELRRRAREMGGRFDLSPSKSEYLVSNNPSLLGPGDILLSPNLRSEILLRIRCDYEEKRGELHVIKASRAIVVDGVTVRDQQMLGDGAIITLGEGQYLRCDFGERIIEEERNIIRSLEIEGVSHAYAAHSPGLDNVTFAVQRGEMICVMGPSGCGKSTLLRVLAGHLKPRRGTVRMNSSLLYDHLPQLAPFISYIPHEDAFDPLLTVEENLSMASQIRSPHLQPDDLKRRVSAKLVELGLNERRHVLAGKPEEKRLSGGERKRLNVGLDMITPADVFLFDEPTSGLSSKDSEHVLEIIRGISHNKIVFVSIHQPSSRLFGMFNKALVLDKGGKMVFFGTPQETLEYFNQAWHEEIAKPMEEESHGNAKAVHPSDPSNPEFIFDILEMPLRDLSGDMIFEEDSRGHTSAARRFPPNFWRDRYASHSLFREMLAPKLRSEAASFTDPAPNPLPQEKRRSTGEKSKILAAMTRRAVMSKFRNRANLATTLLEAPLLAVLIAYTLKFAENSAYNFASAFHVPTYLFLTLVVAMFLGLTNSADEIIRDRVLLNRERNYNKNVGGYIFGKFLALSAVSLVQNSIYLLIGNAILEVRNMLPYYLLWMMLTSLSGVAIGLFVSSLVRDGKTAINIIPLVLIPQIILGGALIKYEEMNRNMDLVYSVRRWLQPDEIGTQREPSKLKVPILCEFMPLRWSYESMVLSQAYHNPMDAAMEELDKRLDPLRNKQTLTPEEEIEFQQAKDALPLVSALHERNPEALHRRLDRIMEDIRNREFSVEKHLVKEQVVTAEEMYQNKKIADLVNKAEFEVGDYNRLVREKKVDPATTPAPNVFFGKKKLYLGASHHTLTANSVMLTLMILAPLALLYLNLRRQLRKVR